MLPSFCTQTIVRRRASTKESRGSKILDWSNCTTSTINASSVQPSGGTIDVNGRVLGITDSYNVYVNLDADIHAGDRIEFNGQIYDVDKEPGIWQSPTGRVSSKQFSMTLRKG